MNFLCKIMVLEEKTYSGCHIIGFALSFEHSTCTPLYHFWFTLHLKIFKNSNSRKFIKTTYIWFLILPIQNQKPLSVNFPFHIRTNRTGTSRSYPSGEWLTKWLPGYRTDSDHVLFWNHVVHPIYWAFKGTLIFSNLFQSCSCVFLIW